MSIPLAPPETGIRFIHRTGHHCGSSALRDLLEFHGIVLSEAFCFGLGSGLGISYLAPSGAPVPYMVHVRSLGFEERVLRTFTPSMSWSTFASGNAAMLALDERLDAGFPALLLTDIFHLPYYGSSTHFPGHAIMAWGRSRESGDVFVTDTERPELLAVPRDKLALARFSNQEPFPHQGNMYSPDSLPLTGSLREAARAAVRCNAGLLLNGSQCSGIAALGHWREQLPLWASEVDWRWTTRFAYQLIEKRGTGGGGFRKMYADFLDELALLDNEIRNSPLPALMRKSASAWTQLALTLKVASEGERFPLTELEAAITAVEHAEIHYAQAALQA
ncbi:butirosin biosynthesis protein H-like [Fluviicoccus keumensis]|uniref:Butirosin biosynthesis protein H-like n=1 Tax=Fluviicoccus keumensis TaxID=1435465 RepID=A0A4Q7YJH7_9GAMM|nr:BtrH N-terminal domain-containing protein [Fluviicoccus keumensis]RZU36771.1 butirosin biosynthesis protein H-like [Fluviicoccus keumensis]